MAKQILSRQFKQMNRVLGALLAITSLGSVGIFSTSLAQVAGFSELPQERELYNTLPGSNQKDTILDATNPMDLMNQLRRATAMDNATSPSDAIDQALRALEDTPPISSSEDFHKH